MTRRLLLLLLASVAGLASSVCFGQGNPPFYTDDAATVKARQWEVDFGANVERSRVDERSWQAPSLGLSYGVTDAVEIDYGVSVLLVKQPEENTHCGLSNSLLGVKWRFFEDAQTGFAVSVNPMVEFDNPTSSRRHGLVENDTEFSLPFQVQKSFGRLDAALNVGRTFHTRASGESDSWIAGIAAGTALSPRWHVGAELYGESARNLAHGFALLNAGGSYQVTDTLWISASLGTGVAGAERPKLVAFLGVQWVR